MRSRDHRKSSGIGALAELSDANQPPWTTNQPPPSTSTRSSLRINGIYIDAFSSRTEAPTLKHSTCLHSIITRTSACIPRTQPPRQPPRHHVAIHAPIACYPGTLHRYFVMSATSHLTCQSAPRRIFTPRGHANARARPSPWIEFTASIANVQQPAPQDRA